MGRLMNLPMVLNRYRVHGDNVSLNDGDRERRLQVRKATLARAFARRGITDREPVMTKTPPPTASEVWRDRALLEHFRGKRQWRHHLRSRGGRHGARRRGDAERCANYSG